jgi:hypothetical protein
MILASVGTGSSPSLGDFQMLKLIALCTIGAGSIAGLLSSELGPDLALAILSAFF